MQDDQAKIYNRVLQSARASGEPIGTEYQLKDRQFKEWFKEWCADKTAIEIAEVLVGQENIARKARKPKATKKKQIAGLSKIESDAVLKELEELKKPLQIAEAKKILQGKNRKKVSSM